MKILCVSILLLLSKISSFTINVRSQIGSLALRPGNQRIIYSTSLTAKRRTSISKRKEDNSEQVEKEQFSSNEIDSQHTKYPSAKPSPEAIFGNQEESIFSKVSIKKKTETLKSSSKQRNSYSINSQLEEDISRFKEKSLLEALDREKSEDTTKNEIIKKLKDVFSAVLIADFFVVIFFLVWFLAAAALQSTNAFLLERFQDIFQPIVVPSLTVLMVGSVASGVLGGDGDKSKM